MDTTKSFLNFSLSLNIVVLHCMFLRLLSLCCLVDWVGFEGMLVMYLTYVHIVVSFLVKKNKQY